MGRASTLVDGVEKRERRMRHRVLMIVALLILVIFRLANLDWVQLTVYVPEDELGRIQLGQTVSATVDSFPERVFQGQVVYVSSQAEFTPRSIQTPEQRASQVFAVKIGIPNPDHALKPGMPADATFVEPSG